MTARLIATLGLVVTGVAALAHADDNQWIAVAGWACLVGSFITLAAALPGNDR